MSTTTAPVKPKAPAPAKPSKPKPTPRKPRRKSAATASKRRGGSRTNEQAALAAMAQAKAKPAARISSTNIKAVQRKLKSQSPTEYLGISAAMLAKLATGAKTKADLKPEPRARFLVLGEQLGSSTFYGKKLAGMLWAIEKGVSTS